MPYLASCLVFAEVAGQRRHQPRTTKTWPAFSSFSCGCGCVVCVVYGVYVLVACETDPNAVAGGLFFRMLSIQHFKARRGKRNDDKEAGVNEEDLLCGRKTQPLSCAVQEGKSKTCREWGGWLAGFGNREVLIS